MRQSAYTVAHLRNSPGKNLYRHPVRSRYGIAHNTSYRSTFVGFVALRTLRSIGSISSNLSRLMSLSYFFLFIGLFQPMTKKIVNTFLPHGFEIADRIYIARLGKRACIVDPKRIRMSQTVAVMSGAMAPSELPAEGLA